MKKQTKHNCDKHQALYIRYACDRGRLIMHSILFIDRMMVQIKENIKRNW